MSKGWLVVVFGQHFLDHNNVRCHVPGHLGGKHKIDLVYTTEAKGQALRVVLWSELGSFQAVRGVGLCNS